MVAPILIIAIGNEARGDDAVGPTLLRRLGSWLRDAGCDSNVELLEDFQLQIEHAADMVGRERVLFIDAGTGMSEPYRFYRAREDESWGPFSHAISPEAVLATYRQVYLQPPPPAHVLCLSAAQFELGPPPSAEALHHMESALEFLQGIFGADTWEAQHAAGEARL